MLNQKTKRTLKLTGKLMKLKTKTVRYLSTEHYSIESHETECGFMGVKITFHQSSHKSFLMMLGCAKIYEINDDDSYFPYSKFSPCIEVNRLNNYIYLELRFAFFKNQNGEQNLQEVISMTEKLFNSNN